MLPYNYSYEYWKFCHHAMAIPQVVHREDIQLYCINSHGQLKS